MWFGLCRSGTVSSHAGHRELVHPMNTLRMLLILKARERKQAGSIGKACGMMQSHRARMHRRA